jgi:glycosyltransferase involved in cell wall biosynthesis
MKILHTVEVFYPPEGGMQKVVREISERLAKKGHIVTIATRYDSRINYPAKNNIVIEQFKISGNLVRGYEGQAKEIKRYQNFLKNSCFDIITNFAAQQWATDLTFPLLEKLKAKKVLVPTGFSGLYLPEYQKYFTNMKNWMKKYDMNVFLSNNYRDINFARTNKIKKRILISNGASEEEFLSKRYIDIKKRLNIPQKNLLLLHVGSHTKSKGHTEAIKIFSQARIINTTFLIIGNKTSKGCFYSCLLKSKFFNISPQRFFDNKKIIIASLNRKEIIGAYKQADLFLFPSNVECSPIVLFECMASKTPFLTSDVGNAQEIIKWSNSGILLPTLIDKKGYSIVNIGQSAKILEQISHNADKRKAMAEFGYKAWQKRFTWEMLGQRYEKMYKRLLNKKT